MTQNELIKKQKEFVEWLKERGMYNPCESAFVMQKMFKVWVEFTQPLVRPRIDELLQS